MISTSATMLLVVRRYIISIDPWCLGNYWLDSGRLPQDSRSTGGPTFRHFAPYDTHFGSGAASITRVIVHDILPSQVRGQNTLRYDIMILYGPEL